MASLVIHQRSSANEMRPPAAGAATTGPRPCARGGHALDRPRAGELAACDKFWADARARLGRLYRLSDRDLDEIESLLAKRIPKPVAGKPQIRIRTQILYRSLRWP